METRRDAPALPTELQERLLASARSTLAALHPEPIGPDRFRAPNEAARFPRLFGGQVVAQAVAAAIRCVEGRRPHSVHAHFLEGGRHDRPVELQVTRLRDGRSFSIRQVQALQEGRPILAATVSFHGGDSGPEHSEPMPGVPGPSALPALQELIQPDAADPEIAIPSRSWRKHPPPLEFRTAHVPGFLAGRPPAGPRFLWLRWPHALPDDPDLHATLLAYASDYLLVDVVAARSRQRRVMGASLDHALWLHAPVRLDDWLLCVQESPVARAGRGLARASYFSRDGGLVASVAQEVLVRHLPPGVRWHPPA